MEDLKYTQEDVDNIVEKAKTNLSAKFEKTHISREEYNSLQAKYNDLLNQDKTNFIQNKFNQSGGNSNAFDDFMAANKQLLDLSKEDIEKEFDNVVNSKPYYFNQQKQTDTITKNMFNENSDLIAGTIYKNFK